MRILGIDPGLRATGYAVVEGTPQEGLGLLAHGVIRTEEDDPLEFRLREIYAAVGLLVKQICPQSVAVEDLYAALRFPRTAILMGHVRGVVCLVAAQQGVEVESLPPAAVKQAITGFGAASKVQVQFAVQRLLRRPDRLDAHESDAAAMALTALSRRGVPLLAGVRVAVP
ncbi:MAG: crossover junction endodeoxyribonuclease RuvC [bacterium]